MMTGRSHKSVVSHGKYTGRYKEKKWSKFCGFYKIYTTGWHCQMALPLTQTARSVCMCMAQQESHIPDWQHQVLQLEACLISLSKGILICPLSFAREVAIAQSHNPQECCHSGNSCSELSGQVEEVCRPSCSTPCTDASSEIRMTAVIDVECVCWVQTFNFVIALPACSCDVTS